MRVERWMMVPSSLASQRAVLGLWGEEMVLRNAEVYQLTLLEKDLRGPPEEQARGPGCAEDDRRSSLPRILSPA